MPQPQRIKSYNSVGLSSVSKRLVHLLSLPIGVVAVLCFGCAEDFGIRGCLSGTEGCSCHPVDDSCDDDLVCVDSVCMPGHRFGNAQSGYAGTDSNETDDDEACGYTCSEHCRSIGGAVMPGECTDDLQCCDLSPDTENESEACEHRCSEHCRSIGGRVMPGECADDELQCCDLDDDTEGDGDMETDGDSTGDFGGVQFVGNITVSGAVRTQDFMQYWDQITPENEGKWGSVEGMRNSYNWGPLRTIYNFAKNNRIPFKQHTMVWGNQRPSWIDSLGPAEQAMEIEQWIEDFCNEFPDTDMIDVVNEAVASHAPANYARNAFGNDWIIRSFELAHQYCPNAVLILNDYNVLRWDTDAFIALARPGISEGVIDAIGCQAHSLGGHDGQPVQSASELRNNLDRIAALGLPIYITEYDIEQGDDNTQLRVMEEQFPIFYEHPSVVGVTLWGYIVGTTWRGGTGLKHADGRHRPALDWLMAYLDRD